MTDAEKQAITEHLAERVMGWERAVTPWIYWLTHDDPPSIRDSSSFDPLFNTRDCSQVMAAWRSQGGELEIIIAKRTITARASTRSGVEHEATSDDSWTEPVCRVIASASGWEG